MLAGARASVDDDLMALYLEGNDLAPSDIRTALRRATIAMRAVPVLIGAAFKNKGVQPLLDAVVDYLPSPLDVPPAAGVNPENGNAVSRPVSDAAPFAPLAFKIISDPVVGQLTYFRVYSGVSSRARRPCGTRPRGSASGSAACFACTPTSAKM